MTRSPTPPCGDLRRRRGGLLCLLLAVLGACDIAAPIDRFPLSDPPSAAIAPDAVVIGLVGTLSGPDAWRGEDAFEGADLGVHALNRARQGARPFELRPLDDGGDPVKATALVEQLAALDSTIGVIYAGPPEGLTPAEGELARAGIPAVLCYGDLIGEGLTSPHLFQTSPPYAAQAREAARYLLGDRDYLRVGAVVEDSPTGSEAARALSEAFALPPGVRYPPGALDLRPQLLRLRSRRVEALVFQGSPRAGSALLRSLRHMGAAYKGTAAARIASASSPVRRRRLRSEVWRPQVVGFDTLASPLVRGAPSGTAAVDSYTRGVHYLPLRPARSFRTDFRDWWGSRPLGWEQRAYEAARLIGWAANRPGRGEDLATALEEASGVRFGGLPVAFNDADHLGHDPATLGLWVVPRPRAGVLERRRVASFESFRWVPLARSFVRDGVTTVLRGDRGAMLRRRPVGPGRSPSRAMRWGVRTSRSDPVH